ncbi:hypothetical protein ACQCVP_04665 [Rossellomorea vietnamensis]|uniref:hypothetical protein n=1 Tax=Rossellomorea vietnamensis TaxID=218284 RepID=UPI003CEEB4AB
MTNREMTELLKKLCLHCRLGEMNEAPESVSGGLLLELPTTYRPYRSLEVGDS